MSGGYDAGPRGYDNDREERPPSPPLPIDDASRDFVAFQVSWGERSGADTRRLLAITCRRGDIESKDIGAIRIGPVSSLVEVRANRAEAFAEASARPDPRDPRVRFRRYQAELASSGPPERERAQPMHARNERTRDERPRPERARPERPERPRSGPRHEGPPRGGGGGERPPKRR